MRTKILQKPRMGETTSVGLLQDSGDNVASEYEVHPFIIGGVIMFIELGLQWT